MLYIYIRIYIYTYVFHENHKKLYFWEKSKKYISALEANISSTQQNLVK